jgi:beta-phosphoglucomutase family hydrolase
MAKREFPTFEAVIFDLDGVITKTAVTHTAAWKKMFDEYLHIRENEHNEPFKEFTQADYLAYVDGKPRYNGVASFLESRGIDLPWGSTEDSIDEETVCGLGNRKNEAFNEVLKREGAEVYPSSEKLLYELNDAGVKLGVASSSKNCKAVLEAVDLLHLFGTRVDGVVSAELGLHGKPEPDIFTTACENLGVKPENSIVVEDAVSGVQAGAKGNFGLTLGVAREDNTEELFKNGADHVVTDLEEVNGVKGLNELFSKFYKKK